MSKLACPHCGNIDTRTIDTRSMCQGSFIMRIRECKCDFRWNTVEVLYNEATRKFLEERQRAVPA